MTTEIAEYSKTEAALAELRDRYNGVVFDVSTTKGMKDACKARAEVRSYRTDLEKKRKEIKAPALERCRLIDAEAKRITEALLELEGPIDETIKAEEHRKEEERLAKLEAERERVQAISDRIDAIRAVPAQLVGRPSAIIRGQLAKLRDQVPAEADFSEMLQTAQDAHRAAIAKVEEQLQAQLEHEAEQARIKAEREELERLREADRVRREEEDRKAAESRAEQERADRERREREEAEHREKLQAEANKRAEAERIEREAEQQRMQKERERLAAERKRLEEEQAQARQREEAARAKAEGERLARMTLRDAAQEVVNYFQGEEFEALGLPVPKCVFDLDTVLNADAKKAREAA